RPGAERHPPLGRAARRGRDRGRRAHDLRRRDDAADARGRGDRRQLPRRHPRQRAGFGARLLHRAEGRRMSALTRLTIAEAREGLAKKEFSARELARAFTAAVERAKPLNAFITETPEKALEMA